MEECSHWLVGNSPIQLNQMKGQTLCFSPFNSCDTKRWEGKVPTSTNLPTSWTPKWMSYNSVLTLPGVSIDPTDDRRSPTKSQQWLKITPPRILTVITSRETGHWLDWILESREVSFSLRGCGSQNNGLQRVPGPLPPKLWIYWIT